MAGIEKAGGRMPRKKGLAAMLDGMLAYLVAFTSIGFITLLLTNTPEADMKSTYSLNVWAEDIADSVVMSINGQQEMLLPVDRLDGVAYGLNYTAYTRGISIHVELEGSPNLYYFNGIPPHRGSAVETVISTRLVNVKNGIGEDELRRLKVTLKNA